MEMRALRQRFDITDEQCQDLIAEMQLIAKDRAAGQKYQIGAFNAIVSAMGLDQRAAIAVMKYHKEMVDAVPDEQLDNVIEGRLADVASESQAPPAQEDRGASFAEGEDDPDGADDPPEGLS